VHDPSTEVSEVNDLSTFRLYFLRAAYLLMAVGLALVIGPGLIDPPPNLEHMRGVVWSLLGAVGLLAMIGVRYPVQMLPLLIFELVWKSIWIGVIGLPRWSAGTLDAGMRATWFDCALGVALMLLVIPWGYVFRNYVRRPGDPWKRVTAHALREAS
jgi:hypothetical protein